MLDAIVEKEKRVVTEAFVNTLADFLSAGRAASLAHRSVLAKARGDAKRLLDDLSYKAAVGMGFRAAGPNP